MADIFKRLLWNESVVFFVPSSLKCIPWCRIDHKSVMVQVMAWRLNGHQLN